MDYFNIYRTYLMNRKSPLTQKSYLHTIERYFLFLKGQEPNEPNSEQFLAYLNHKGCNTRSLNRHLSALKSFFKQVLRRELIIESYRFDRKLPNWLDEDERKKYLAACQTPFEKALVKVLLGAGLRVSETANLEISNVDPDGYLKVMGKGGEEGVVAVEPQVIEAINEYLTVRIDHSSKVFPRGARTMEKIIKEIGKRAKLSKKITPHVLRHSAATSLLDRGFDLVEVRDQLRHKNISTTSIYVHTKPTKIKKKLDLLSKK